MSREKLPTGNKLVQLGGVGSFGCLISTPPLSAGEQMMLLDDRYDVVGDAEITHGNDINRGFRIYSLAGRTGGTDAERLADFLANATADLLPLLPERTHVPRTAGLGPITLRLFTKVEQAADKELRKHMIQPRDSIPTE
jgi:hypothetical protein